MIKNSETVRGRLIKVDLSYRFDKEVLFISLHSLLDPLLPGVSFPGPSCQVSLCLLGLARAWRK